jgi:hypothetical protein
MIEHVKKRNYSAIPNRPSPGQLDFNMAGYVPIPGVLINPAKQSACIMPTA